MTKEVENFHPGLSIDCVIFGFHENELRVLLLKVKNLEKHALPGGFVRKNEDVDQAAVHVLKERTGLEDIFLTQFHLFGEVNRSQAGHVEDLIEKRVIKKEWYDWFAQRFVSVGYYALVEYSRVSHPQPDPISQSCDWWPLSDLPELMLDHEKILLKAYETLKARLLYEPVGLNLLPEYFTMPELQSLYETILNKKLDRRNFQRKMLGYGILIRTDRVRTGGAHKAPYLYRFDQEKYERALREGLRTMW